MRLKKEMTEIGCQASSKKMEQESVLATWRVGFWRLQEKLKIITQSNHLLLLFFFSKIAKERIRKEREVKKGSQGFGVTTETAFYLKNDEEKLDNKQTTTH